MSAQSKIYVADKLLGYCNESVTRYEGLDQLSCLLMGLHKKWTQA